MPTLSGLFLPLTVAHQQFTSGLSVALTAVREFGAGVDKATGGLTGLSVSLNLTGGAFEGLAAGFRNTVAASIDLAARNERNAVIFESLTGSAGAARLAMEGLQRTAMAVPVELGALQQAEQRMLAFGFSAQQSEGMLKNLLNIASAMPGEIGDNLQKLTRFVDLLRERGQVDSFMLRSIEHAGVPVRQVLADRLGVDVTELNRMLQRHEVPASELAGSLLDLGGPGGRFGDAAEARAKTFEGAFQIVRTNLETAYRELGRVIIDAFDLKGATAGLVETISAVRENIEAWRPTLQLIGAGFVAVRDIATAGLLAILDNFKDLAGTSENLEERIAAVREGVINLAERAGQGIIELVAWFELLIAKVAEFGDKAGHYFQIAKDAAGGVGGAILEWAVNLWPGAPGSEGPAVDIAARAERRIEELKAALAKLRGTQAPDAVFGAPGRFAGAGGLAMGLGFAAGQLGIFDQAGRAAGAAAGLAFAAEFKRAGGAPVDANDLFPPQLNQALIERSRTPFEKLMEDFDSWQKMFAAGTLTDLAFTRLAGEEGAKVLQGLGTVRAPGALTAGTQQTASVIAGFFNQGQQGNDIPALLRQAAERDRIRDAYLRDIKRAAEDLYRAQQQVGRKVI